MSTADHPRTDGQTERVNLVLEDTLRIFCAEAPRSWSDELPMVEFTLNNAVQASTGFTPFYLNGLRRPQIPIPLLGGTDAVGERLGKPFPPTTAFIETVVVIYRQQIEAISRRRNGVDPEQTKEYSDNNDRGNLSVFMVGDLILLNTKNLPLTIASLDSLGSSAGTVLPKPSPREVNGDAPNVLRGAS
ncbi:LOW QUALITY PROTEIN: Pol protein [Phytophthora palmivora]|uniref:Pol protein n=1 Tax=Phytophthora palmivora TaxID=4796 RepID=A0A2P4YCS3_9STRA|nr:LOW QUALITY PROTEIN: Pol protein [Phytophthora palmivora]